MMRIKFIEIRHMHELIQLDSGQSNSLSRKGGTRKKAASPHQDKNIVAIQF